MSKIIEGLLYSKSHEWVKVEGDTAIIGVSDFAQKSMGAITYVDVPDVDDEIEAEEDFGALESVKAASELISPLSGVVMEVNEDLENEPELINSDAYANWILKLKMSNPDELKSLMDAKSYAEFISE